MYSLVAVVVILLLYLKVVKRIDPKSINHKREHFYYVCKWMLIRLIVLIFGDTYTY